MCITLLEHRPCGRGYFSNQRPKQSLVSKALPAQRVVMEAIPVLFIVLEHLAPLWPLIKAQNVTVSLFPGSQRGPCRYCSLAVWRVSFCAPFTPTGYSGKAEAASEVSGPSSRPCSREERSSSSTWERRRCNWKATGERAASTAGTA